MIIDPPGLPGTLGTSVLARSKVKVSWPQLPAPYLGRCLGEVFLDQCTRLLTDSKECLAHFLVRWSPPPTVALVPLSSMARRAWRSKVTTRWWLSRQITSHQPDQRGQRGPEDPPRSPIQRQSHITTPFCWAPVPSIKTAGFLLGPSSTVWTLLN